MQILHAIPFPADPLVPDDWDLAGQRRAQSIQATFQRTNRTNTLTWNGWDGYLVFDGRTCKPRCVDGCRSGSHLIGHASENGADEIDKCFAVRGCRCRREKEAPNHPSSLFPSRLIVMTHLSMVKACCRVESSRLARPIKRLSASPQPTPHCVLSCAIGE